MKIFAVRRSILLVAIPFFGLLLAIQGYKIFQYYAALYDAKSAVRHILKDPTSAEFEGLEFIPLFDKVCGKVNARNSLGGYVGRKRFIWSSMDKSVDMEGGQLNGLPDESFNIVWETYCKK